VVTIERLAGKRARRLTRLALAGTEGANTLKLARVGKSRRLTPGRYRATVVSGAVRAAASFRIR
jgi:hypothetical protein